MLDSLAVDELDFEGFKEFMANYGSHSFITSLRGFPVPNPAKVHDLPLIGTCTSLTQDVLVDAYQWTAGAIYKRVKKTPETDLKAKFQELDADKDGAITKKDVAKGLRELGVSEIEIKNLMMSIDTEHLSIDEFRNAAHRGPQKDEEGLTFDEFCNLVWSGQAIPPPPPSDAGDQHPLKVLGSGLKTEAK